VIPGKKYAPEDFLRVLLRRKWLLIVPFVIVAATTALVTHLLPDRYRSEAVILVIPQRVPEEFVKSTVTTKLENRLSTISQQILSRARLESIISEFNLYPEYRQHELMEDVVQRMRSRDVDIHVVRGNAFRVAFESEDRLLAFKVTERLAKLFIDESLRDRAVQAQGTDQFLESQLEETKQRLIAHEKKLEEYRQQHAGELPSQLQSNLSAANNAQLQLQSLNDSISRDRDRLQGLERDLNDMVQEQSNNVGAVDPQGGGTAAQQLEAARRDLRNLELRLKPEHPDVVRLKRVIKDLEQKAEAEALQSPVSGGGRPASAAEATRQSRIKQLQEGVESLRTQVARKEQDAQRARDVLARYQARADAAPERETELIDLNRDYDTLRRMYTDLLRKSQESKMAANLEEAQIGEQFRYLEPPRLPERPFSPNRPELDLLGALGGLAVGFGLVALSEYRDTSLKTDEDVITALSLPVLATIPMMMTTRERQVRRRRRVLVSMAAVLMSLVAAATAVWFVWRA
jgi:polysaccharide chain length determinant protein (PEP-CTERM system associated)